MGGNLFFTGTIRDANLDRLSADFALSDRDSDFSVNPRQGGSNPIDRLLNLVNYRRFAAELAQRRSAITMSTTDFSSFNLEQRQYRVDHIFWPDKKLRFLTLCAPW